ncbi:cupin-like domain-domain-containing protein [Protomyces lactucae-debilis]|uniref:Cupin-like domain-domain-containing protein n=1 Tax=Protomyces lactucae-debilis TaxID=2754530 RepID=A0A1Y2F9E0_PROLT|nr:cupin-like domain-containing protein [Protomyces lactucae-debilis]ORY80521.1 cupin-like domain-domain-containing protein [Protomyces lactucae-debilis]
MDTALLEACILQLIKTNQDSTSAHVAEHHGVPSAEELVKMKASRFPTRITGAIDHFGAMERWSASYFRHTMGSATVTCAVTPTGEADSVQGDYFVQPFQARCTMNSMLDWIAEPKGNVRYLQLQNGSLQLEFQALQADVEPNGPYWAASVFGEGPLANIWIGNHSSRTSLHSDSFENLFCQIRGSKRFTLYPPHEYHLLNEAEYTMASYMPTEGEDGLQGTLNIVPDTPVGKIPWLQPPEPPHPKARPIHVILGPGETLYLPPLWFHEVQQIDDPDDGLCCSVNYWYDMDYLDGSWAQWKFLRKISLLARGMNALCAQELAEEEDDDDGTASSQAVH